MLVTTTDLQVPKDVSWIGIQVIGSNGVERHGQWYRLGPSPDKNELPATLAIAPGTNDDPVQVRLFAQRDNKVIMLTEATTTVPRNRVAMLRMPVEWLSVGMVKAADATSTTDAGEPLFPGDATFKANVTTCPQGMTPRAGTCVSARVDSATLPTYTPGQVNGGGNGSGNGTCFDTVNCFANALPVAISDRQNCVIDANTLGVFAASTGVTSVGAWSFGLIPADGSGICGSNGCVVTLDFIEPGATGSGWTFENDPAVKLPAAVCEKLANGSLRAVVAAAGCDSKTAEMPNCGPWSSVESSSAGKPIESDLLGLCWDFAEKACEGIRRCRGGTHFIDGVAEDDGTCTERLRFLCDASLVEPAAEPWRKYFTDCGAAFSESSCSQLERKVRTDCVEPATSTKADRETCSFGQCGTASSCFGAVPNGLGQCTPRLVAGNPMCGTNSAIDALLPQGACKSGLICDHATQTCRKPGATDEACFDDSSCQPDLVCIKGKCATAIGEGGTCSDDQQCAAGLHCVIADNKQQCRGLGQAGESCRVVATDQQSVIWQENLCDLAKGLRCDSETGTCGLARLVKQGGDCTPLNTCAGGYCSGKLSQEATSIGTCVAYHADGTPCESTAQCGPPAECLEKVCRLRPVFGCAATTMQAVPGSLPFCPNGKPPCDTGCVDLTRDSNNCGQCNVKCPAGAQCVNGSCDCGSDQVTCDGVCTSVQRDLDHCGDCSVKCNTGETCSSGMCTRGCTSGLSLCGTACVNFLNDANHCGDCATTCTTEATCVSGKCQVASGSGGATSIGSSSATGGSTAPSLGTGGAATGGTSAKADAGVVAVHRWADSSLRQAVPAPSLRAAREAARVR
jgi:hypothetical protein